VRAVLIGGPGAGKTRLARTLARQHGLSHIELDAVLHGPGGVEPSDEEFRDAILPRLEGDAWVVDGWHERRLGTLALERADVVVFLDPPLVLIVWRLLRRTVPDLILRRELWNGNRQTVRGAFGGRNSLLGYALRRHPDLRRRLPEALRDPKLGKIRYVKLRTSGDVRRWLRDPTIV
jgi:adenylate kinase family enzyme